MSCTRAIFANFCLYLISVSRIKIAITDSERASPSAPAFWPSTRIPEQRNNRHVTGATSAMSDSSPGNLDCFPNNTSYARYPKRCLATPRREQPYVEDRYLINYESRAQSPVAGCISAVIVSRELLRPLTQFRILSLISIED